VDFSGFENGMQRFLVTAGLFLVLAGLLWPWLSRLPFGRLPGDIRIVRDGFSFYFPITTCVVISLALSLLLWLWRR
jgi:ribose/xylose/arabinose/galactoside ABC-type transport system permease subunit